MARRTSPGLIALSSAAIVSLWGAGYLATRPAAAAMAASEAAAAKTDAAPTATPSPLPSRSPEFDEGQGRPRRRGEGRVEGSPPSPAAAPARASQPPTSPSPAAVAGATAALLKDGTYSGAGMGRRGGVNVAVTILNGRITSAAITGLTIHYPHNILNALPPEVVARQSSQVDLISGATDSSLAFRQAIAQALSKAKLA